MDVSYLNQQLISVYQPYLDSLYNQAWPTEVSAPLLMNVFEEYSSMEKKILYVGQETQGWGEMSKKASVQRLQLMYTNFNLGKSANYGDGKPTRCLRSPFWNFSRSFFHRVNYRNLEVSRKTNGFLWTNISKFDHNTTTPSAALQQQNKAGFELFRQELAIIKPDIVVFLTGTKYDSWLNQLFSLEKVPLLENDFLTLLHDKSNLLPSLTFQTAHPRTLSMQKMYHTVLDKMVELANS